MLSVLRQSEKGVSRAEICKKFGISEATFYRWKARSAGASVDLQPRLKSLEEENVRLKRIVADLCNVMLKDRVEKSQK
jgi:putative transposase